MMDENGKLGHRYSLIVKIRLVKYIELDLRFFYFFIYSWGTSRSER